MVPVGVRTDCKLYRLNGDPSASQRFYGLRAHIDQVITAAGFKDIGRTAAVGFRHAVGSAVENNAHIGASL